MTNYNTSIKDSVKVMRAGIEGEVLTKGLMKVGDRLRGASLREGMALIYEGMIGYHRSHTEQFLARRDLAGWLFGNPYASERRFP